MMAQAIRSSKLNLSNEISDIPNIRRDRERLTALCRPLPQVQVRKFRLVQRPASRTARANEIWGRIDMGADIQIGFDVVAAASVGYVLLAAAAPAERGGRRGSVSR